MTHARKSAFHYLTATQRYGNTGKQSFLSVCSEITCRVSLLLSLVLTAPLVVGVAVHRCRISFMIKPEGLPVWVTDRYLEFSN